MPTFRDDLHLGHSVPMVDTEDIVDGAITEPKLADDSVSTRTIQDGAVTEPKIAEKAVTEPKLADAAVSTRTIKFRAVTESKIGDSAVSTRTIQNGAVTNPKIANGAVSMNKLDNETQTLIQRGADSSWTPKGDFNIETTYDANDVVFDPVTNSSYLSLRADNTGHPVDENDEEYEEGWWMKVLDGSYVNRAIEEMEAAITQAIEDAQEDIDDAIAGANTAAQTATDAAGAATTAKNTLVTEISQSLAVYETVADTIVTDPEAATGMLPVQNYVLGRAIDPLTEQFKEKKPFFDVSQTINNKTTYFPTAIPFEVGKSYKVRVELGAALAGNCGFYLSPTPNSTSTNIWLVSVQAGNTSAERIYTPSESTNYKILYSYNNGVATSCNVTIEELGVTDLQDVLSKLNDKDTIKKTSVGTVLNIAPDPATSQIISNNTQRGYLYRVRNGEKIWVVDSNLDYAVRYAFIPDYPYVGMPATSGWINTSIIELTSDVDGYFFAARTSSYPPITVYTKDNHIDYLSSLEENKESRADIKFGHKLSYDASSLSVRSSATYADGVITLASGGSAKGTVNMFNDEVLITAVIKPTSNTFSIQFGQYYADAGTLFGLRTDGTDSYLDLYAGTTLKASIELDFALTNGVEYMLMIKRVTLDRSYVYLDIISNNGQRYSLNKYNTSDGTLGRMWGALYCAASSGTCEVKNINVYSPYKSGCKVAVVGHSFVEGYSIAGMRLQRFARLLQDTLGKEECGIFGQGGCKMADSLTLIQNYLPQYNPQYVLCCVGTNDNSMTLANWKTWRNNIISACGVISATPVFFTIPPDGGSYEGEWNSINAFIRTCGSLYVDMDKCFTNNGSPVAARYLYDNCHPNPATHYSIYLRILQDLPQIVENVDNLQSMQEEIDLLNLVPDYIVTNPVFINVNTLTRQVGALGSGQEWTTGAGASHVAIPVNAGDNFIIAGDTTNFWGWATSSYSPPYSNHDPVPYVTGCDRVRSGVATIQTAPSGAAYLIVGVINGAGTAGTWQIVKVDSYTQRNNNSFVKFKFASWNIGRFVYYNYKTTHQTSDISDENADAYALEYRKIINATGADILGICEYEPKYPRYNSSGNTKDIIFSCFKQAREGQRLKASFCNALFMNSPQYISMSEKVFDHTVSGSPRYYIDVLCKIGGKEVHVVETHLEWTDDSIRALQIEELIDTMSVYPYVIMAGDFNTDSSTVETEMQPFIDAGYAVANGGYIGSFVTHEDNYKLDNIVAKGFAMSNIKVDENAGNYSDHWIISCDLEML